MKARSVFGSSKAAAIATLIIRYSAVALLLSISVSVQAGSCNYIQENMFAGPFKVCAAPVDQERCDEFADEGSNADAVFGEESCSDKDVVGVCTMEGYSISYYTGDAESLEVGCSFQGGDWK
jgi:hypothetical protein